MVDFIIFKNNLKNIYYKLFNKELLKNFPDWKNILKNINFDNKKKLSNKKILIATSTGGHRLALSSEILFGLSLKVRNADVDFLLCDQALDACSECTYFDFKSSGDFIKYGASLKCPSCWHTGNNSLKSAGIKTLKYLNYLTSDNLREINNIIKKTNLDEIKKFKIEGISIGEHANAGALRYHAKGYLDNTENELAILKKYFISALKTFFIAKNLFKSKKFDTVVLNHGIYVPQGIISEVARKNNVNVVTWFTAYKNKSFLFSHDETYHKSLLKEPSKEWEDIEFKINEENKLNDYLSSRKIGSNDWVYFHNKDPNFNFEIKNYNSLKETKFVSLFTNVVWDAQLFFDQNIFDDMLDWLFKTIQYFIDQNKILVVRAHPAEISGTLPSKQKISDEIKKKFGKLANNIVFIAPENPISSYSIIEKSEFCIVYGSTIGTEIAAMGKNVLVGGEAWIKNKEISFDPKTKSEYFDLMSKLILNPKMDEKTHKRAKMYAYHFFFKRMIPVNLIDVEKKKNKKFIITNENIKKIFPVNNFDKGIDTICDGILNQRSFIYEE